MRLNHSLGSLHHPASVSIQSPKGKKNLWCDLTGLLVSGSEGMEAQLSHAVWVEGKMFTGLLHFSGLGPPSLQ